jgi:hypothetical protein
MKRIPLLILLLLSGCASFKSSWVGKDSSAVVDKFGVPSNSMKFKDVEFWEYISDCRGSSVYLYNYGYPISSSSNRCTHRTFKIKDDKVIDAKKSFK